MNGSHGGKNRLLDPMEGLKRGFSTAPSLSVRDAVVHTGDYDVLLDEGSRLRIPVVGLEESLGLDEETWGITSNAFLARPCLEWWCDGPGEWRDFTDWVARLRNFLQRCLDTDQS